MAYIDLAILISTCLSENFAKCKIIMLENILYLTLIGFHSCSEDKMLSKICCKNFYF